MTAVALWVNSGSAVVTDCAFESNQARWSGGGAYAGDCALTASNCVFVGNTADDNGGGLYLHCSCRASALSECSFTGNTAAYGGGLFNYSY